MAIFRREHKSNAAVIETDGDIKAFISGAMGGAPYTENPYVYKCADLKSTVCASIRPLVVDGDGNEVTVPQLERVFRRPNPLQSWRDLVYNAVMDLSLTGNGYIIHISDPGRGGQGEIWQVDSRNVTPNETSDLFMPVRSWRVGAGRVMTIELEDMAHIHTRLNASGTKGIDPLSPIRQSIEQQAAARLWNVSMMKNGSKPTLMISDPNRMTAEAFDEFKRRFMQSNSGSANAGRAIILDGGKTAAGIGYSALDMDFANCMVVCAREIAIGMGVPPELVGDSANKTYSNAAEANKEFAEHTILPILEQLYGQLTKVLIRDTISLQRGIRITYDQTQIDDLRGGREALMASLAGAGYLTVNEKRGMLNYPPVDGGDVVMVGAGEIPIAEATAPTSDLISSIRSEPS